MKASITSLFLFFTSLNIFCQDTIRVPQTYTTIQEAFDNCGENTVVLVGPGTYIENLTWPENIKGIQLISESGSAETTIEGNAAGRVLYKKVFSDVGAIIQGFTITNGKSGEGAGLFIERGQTDLIDLNIRNNEARGEFHCYGGAVRLENYTGIIRSSRITGNEAYGIGTCSGAGMFIQTFGDVEMYDVLISSNRSNGGNSSSVAGFFFDGLSSSSLELNKVRVSSNRNIHNTWGLNPGALINTNFVRIDSCNFAFNSNSSGATNAKGGGLSINSEDGIILNSNFVSNSSKEGTGIRIYGSDNNLKFENCSITSNQGESAVLIEDESGQIEFLNCIIANNNQCAGIKIGPDNISDQPSFVNFNHVTIANNDRAFDYFKGIVYIQNSILWNYIQDDELEIDIQPFGQPWIEVSSSIVRNGWEGTLILDEDPLLNYDDLIPAYNSPAANFANPNFSPLSSIFDLDRPTPANTLPDLGAVEINQARTYVDVHFYYDENNNGTMDEQDFNISKGSIEYQSGTYINIDTTGIVLDIEMGENVITYLPDLNPAWELKSPAQFVETVSDSSYYNSLSFGLKPINDSVNITSNLLLNPFRCGETIDGKVVIQNELSSVTEAYVWLEIDDRIDDIDFGQMTPDITDGENVFGWKFEDLKHAQYNEIGLTLIVPEITSPDDLNESYYFQSWATEDEQGLLSLGGQNAYEPQMRCSYDPNDKLVSQEQILEEDVNSTVLNYTIRFQNTGNDYAKDVVLIDTLGAHLKAGSMVYVSSSHPDHLVMVREEANVLRFEFEDIFLIDSLTNPELSQGYISFNVAPVEDLDVGDIIFNKAYIYFDANPPIITNEAITEIIKEVSAIDELKEIDVDFYPNPVQNTITFSKVFDRISVLTIEGRILTTVQNTDQVNVMNLKSGSYILLCYLDDLPQALKFIKE